MKKGNTPKSTLRACYWIVNFVFTLGTWPSSREPTEGNGAGSPEGQPSAS
jgi:hypothetical protein